MKNLIITGGSSGIGEAIVHKFLSNAYNVHNLDIKNNSAFHNHTHYFYYEIDLTNTSQIKNIIEKIAAEYSIHTVIANAGKHLSANIEETEDEDLYALFKINLLSAFYFLKYSIPHMKKNGGNIITIGSDQSLIVKRNSTVYGMTKSGLASLTKSIALDYAKYNIRANCIAAGTIDTPLYRHAIERYAHKTNIPLHEIEKSEATHQPMGRIGKPSEIAELAFFLSQEGVEYLTGAVIPIDGGYTIE